MTLNSFQKSRNPKEALEIHMKNVIFDWLDKYFVFSEKPTITDDLFIDVNGDIQLKCHLNEIKDVPKEIKFRGRFTFKHTLSSNDIAKHKLFGGYTEEIESWLNKNQIKGYTVIDDLFIDVNGEVILMANHLAEIPKYIRFRNVTGQLIIKY